MSEWNITPKYKIEMAVDKPKLNVHYEKHLRQRYGIILIYKVIMALIWNIQHLKMKEMPNTYVQCENVTAIKLGFHLNNETIYIAEVLSILSQLNILSHIRTALIIK